MTKHDSSEVGARLEEFYASIEIDQLSREELLSRVQAAPEELFREVSGAVGGLCDAADVAKVTVLLEHYFELATVRLFASAPGGDPNARFEENLDVFRAAVSRPGLQDAAARFIGYLLLSLEELPPSVRERALAYLASLTRRQEGIPDELPPFDRKVPEHAIPRLSRLLDLGLFSEVFSFLSARRRIDPVVEGDEDGVSALVATVASRKGGVGKSTMILSLLLSLGRAREGMRVCILDFDLTGAVWQYVLAPNGCLPDGSPLRYLNSLVDIEQPEMGFDFGVPDPEEVLAVVGTIPLPGAGTPVGLVTFADWPRTNRYLAQAMSLNRGSFTKFLKGVLRALSERFDAILIDTSPGFDPQCMVTLVVAAQAQRGLPIVVSTPFLPDLRGTLLELADLRLLPLARPPVWIINKARPEVDEFFGQPRTLHQIAEQSPSYARLLPPCPPLLGRALGDYMTTLAVTPMPYDASLEGFSSLMEGANLDEEAIRAFLGSRFFGRFEEKVRSLFEVSGATSAKEQ